jgi:outer membrane receptor protein involved in Fe transport
MKARHATRTQQNTVRAPFRLTPIKAAMLGLSLLASGPLYAAEEEETAPSNLKKENARLKQALAQIQKKLATKNTNPPQTPASDFALQEEIARLKQALAQKQQTGAVTEVQVPTTAPGAATAETPLITQTAEEEKEEKKSSENLLKELTVHAAKRSEVAKLKDIPKSISQVSGTELDKFSATNVTDILRRVGNVQWNYGNPRTGSYTMRGLNVGASDLIDPSVMVVVDGVSKAYSGLTSGTDFFDMESINVTRGPQGTEGRKNSSVGEINFNTQKPTFNNLADVSVMYGQNNTVKTQAVANGEIISNTLAMRTSFLRNASDGWYSNAWPDNPQRQSYGNTDRTEARTQLLWTPNEDFKTLVNFSYQPKGMEYVNGIARATPNPNNYLNDAFGLNKTTGKFINLGTNVNLTNLTQTKLTRGYFQNTLPSYNQNDYYAFPLYTPSNGGIINSVMSSNINTDYKLDGHTLKFIGGYDSNFFQAANDDLLPYNIFSDGGYITRYQQVSQELRLESDPGAFGGLVDYKAGLFNFYSDDISTMRTRYGSDAGAWYATGLANSATTAVGSTAAAVSQYDCLYSGQYCPGSGATGQNLGSGVKVINAGTVNAAGQTGQGRSLMTAALNNLYKNTVTNNVNFSDALYSQSQWHLDELFKLNSPLTLTTGFRANLENRQGDGNTIIADQGAGSLLNPINVGGIQLGGFGDSGTTGALNSTDTKAQIATANKVAQEFFGTSTYSALTANEKVLVAEAQAVRKSQINTLYNTTKASAFNGVLLNGNTSLSYKLDDAFDNSYSPYFSWQRGAKSGFSQIIAVQNGAYGTNMPGKAETSNVFEIGLKNQFFHKTLDVNADVFVDYIHNFQQSVNVINPVASLNPGANCPGQNVCYTSASGNVAGVRVQGIELDTAYRPVDNLSFRFAGAFNDAVYTNYTNAALPSEIVSSVQNSGLYNMTGMQVPRAPKFTGNLAADYSQPVFEKYVAHSNLNLSYIGRQNYDLSDSRYGWIDAYWLTSMSVGIGRKDRLFDANLIVNNLFDTGYNTTSSWNSYTPGYGRWVGIQFSSKM